MHTRAEDGPRRKSLWRLRGRAVKEGRAGIARLKSPPGSEEFQSILPVSVSYFASGTLPHPRRWAIACPCYWAQTPECSILLRFPGA